MRKRSICADALDMFAAQTRDLYHIEFTAGKYIDFAFRQKYRIAEQYIDKSHPDGWLFKFPIDKTGCYGVC